MVPNATRKLVCLNKLAIIRNCGPKYVNVIHLLWETLLWFSLIWCFWTSLSFLKRLACSVNYIYIHTFSYATLKELLIFKKTYCIAFSTTSATWSLPDLVFKVALYSVNITSILWSNLGLPGDLVSLSFQTNTSMYSHSLLSLRNSEKLKFCSIPVNAASPPKAWHHIFRFVHQCQKMSHLDSIQQFDDSCHNSPQTYRNSHVCNNT